MALVEIIVPVAVYAFKSTVENLSKNNRWPDKRLADTEARRTRTTRTAAGPWDKGDTVMTEKELQENVVAIAESFIGCKESDGSHKKIIDLYNSHKPLARGYPVKYTGAWCGTLASAVAIKAGLTDIIPTECGCEKHIALFKALGRWQENDAYTPKSGNYIFYDWQDGANYAATDNTGGADHVGIVVYAVETNMKIIEGNISDAVGYRTMKGNGRYIRGYGVPDYASKATGSAGDVRKTYTVGKTNEETFVNFCREVLGLNLTGALGAAANVGCESNFKAGAIGDSGTSYGICQWYASRYTNLQTWCAANGLDYTTLDGQFWYMKHELETSYSAVLWARRRSAAILPAIPTGRSTTATPGRLPPNRPRPAQPGRRKRRKPSGHWTRR